MDQPVCIRLNSGTSILPKGLKCNIKISSSASLDDIYDHSNLESNFGDDGGSGYYDYHIIQVTLHRHDHDKDQLPISYFILDYQIDPFQTYEQLFILRSRFIRPQICSINQWAQLAQQSQQIGTKGSANSNYLNSTLSSLLGMNYNNQKSLSLLANECCDYTLILSWPSQCPLIRTQLGSIQQSIGNGTSCQFTLYQPFHVYTRLHTCGRRKLVEVTVRGSAKMNSSTHLLVKPPQLSHYQCQKEARSLSTNFFYFKHLSQCQQETVLESNSDLHFVWELLQQNACSENDDNNDGELQRFPPSNLFKRFMIHFAFCVQNKRTTVGDDPKTKQMQDVQYEVRLGFDYRTRYIIREYIEPMIGQKSSELFRIGNSCLFRVTFERLFPSTIATSTKRVQMEADVNDHEGEDEEDEFIIYELIFDSNFWSLVNSYRSYMNIEQQQPSFINSISGVYDSLTSTATITSDYSSLSGLSTSGTSLVSSGIESMNHQSTVKQPEFNVASKVLKLTKTEPLFEVHFEMMPLTDGYIPLPSVRLSKYIPVLVTDGAETLSSLNTITSLESMNYNNDSLQQRQYQQYQQDSQQTTLKQHISSMSTIETLSAKLTENLSKSNWTSKLMPNSSTQKSKQSSHFDNGHSNHHFGHLQQNSRLSSMGRLIAFEPGQEYNYNRASQVYVLPVQQQIPIVSSSSTLIQTTTMSTNTVIPTATNKISTVNLNNTNNNNPLCTITTVSNSNNTM